MKMLKSFLSSWFVWKFLGWFFFGIAVVYVTGFHEKAFEAVINDPHKITWITLTLFVVGLLITIKGFIKTQIEDEAIEKVSDVGFNWDKIPKDINNSWLYHHLMKVRTKYENTGSVDQSDLKPRLANLVYKDVLIINNYCSKILKFGFFGTFFGLSGTLIYLGKSISNIENLSATIENLNIAMVEGGSAVATTLIAIVLGTIIIKFLNDEIKLKRDSIITKIIAVTSMMPPPKKIGEEKSEIKETGRSNLKLIKTS